MAGAAWAVPSPRHPALASSVSVHRTKAGTTKFDLVPVFKPTFIATETAVCVSSQWYREENARPPALRLGSNHPRLRERRHGFSCSGLDCGPPDVMREDSTGFADFLARMIVFSRLRRADLSTVRVRTGGSYCFHSLRGTAPARNQRGGETFRGGGLGDVADAGGYPYACAGGGSVR